MSDAPFKCSVPGCDRTFQMAIHLGRHESAHKARLEKEKMSATATNQPAKAKRGRPRKDVSHVLPDLDSAKRGPGRPKGSTTRKTTRTRKPKNNGQVNDHVAAVRQIVEDLRTKRDGLVRELNEVDETLARVKELVDGN